MRRILIALPLLVLLAGVANALTQGAVTCATTATRVGTNGIAKVQLIVKNPTGAANTAYVGGATVTASGATQGLPLAAGQEVESLGLSPSEAVFCIAVSTPVVLNFYERSSYVPRAATNTPTPTPTQTPTPTPTPTP